MCGIEGAILCKIPLCADGAVMEAMSFSTQAIRCGTVPATVAAFYCKFQRRWRGGLCILIDLGGFENDGSRRLYLISLYTFTTFLPCE